MDCNTLPSWWGPDGLYWVRFDQLALHAIAGQLPNNSLIRPHRLSSYSGSDCSGRLREPAGVGSTVRRNTICHMSIIPSEELERIKQTMRDWWVVAP
jgi:hypothetical protein